MVQSQTFNLLQWLKCVLTLTERWPVLSVMKGRSQINRRDLCEKATRAQIYFKGVAYVCSAARSF